MRRCIGEIRAGRPVSTRARPDPLKEVHIVVGVAAIVVNALAGLYGGWRWWRVEPRTVWFWRLLRAGQALVVIEAALGGVLGPTDRKAPGLTARSGRRPVTVSFAAAPPPLA